MNLNSENIPEGVQAAKAQAMDRISRGKPGGSDTAMPFSLPPLDGDFNAELAINTEADYFDFGGPEQEVEGEIVGHGIGLQTEDGSPVIRIYAKGMTSEHAFRRAHGIPDTIDGLRTRVVRTSGIRALSSASSMEGRQRTRPIRGGISVGHRDITAGTLGCFVVDEQGEVFMLSNNHVLANVNAAQSGDPILQPAPKDGGNERDKVGELAHFEALDFSGPNAMDAAVARVLVDDEIDYTILAIGDIVPPRSGCGDWATRTEVRPNNGRYHRSRRRCKCRHFRVYASRWRRSVC